MNSDTIGMPTSKVDSRPMPTTGLWCLLTFGLWVPLAGLTLGLFETVVNVCYDTGEPGTCMGVDRSLPLTVAVVLAMAGATAAVGAVARKRRSPVQRPRGLTVIGAVLLVPAAALASVGSDWVVIAALVATVLAATALVRMDVSTASLALLAAITAAAASWLIVREYLYLVAIPGLFTLICSAVLTRLARRGYASTIPEASVS